MDACSQEMLTGRTLGLLIASPPTQPAFRHALGLAQAALAAGIKIYTYFLDDAVNGLQDPQLLSLLEAGLTVYACAYGVRKRRVRADDRILLAGLTIVNDLITATDRFVCL